MPDLIGLKRFKYIIYIFKEFAESEKFKFRLWVKIFVKYKIIN